MHFLFGGEQLRELQRSAGENTFLTGGERLRPTQFGVEQLRCHFQMRSAAEENPRIQIQAAAAGICNF